MLVTPITAGTAWSPHTLLLNSHSTSHGILGSSNLFPFPFSQQSAHSHLPTHYQPCQHSQKRGCPSPWQPLQSSHQPLPLSSHPQKSNKDFGWLHCLGQSQANWSKLQGTNITKDSFWHQCSGQSQPTRWTIQGSLGLALQGPLIQACRMWFKITQA